MRTLPHRPTVAFSRSDVFMQSCVGFRYFTLQLVEILRRAITSTIQGQLKRIFKEEVIKRSRHVCQSGSTRAKFVKILFDLLQPLSWKITMQDTSFNI